jgi:TonB family protein
MRILVGVTLGLALVLLLRRPARRLFGAGPAFTLWLLPVVLMLAPLLPQELKPAAMVVLPVLTVTPHAATAASPTISAGWTNLLAALWLFGAAFGLLRLAMHYFRLLRGTHAAPATWTRMLGETAPHLDVRRVRMHDAGPAVLWALPRSLILLPADFFQRFDTAAMRELVLRHELTHARRGDALWSLALEVASALLWFHPLAWIARARFRLDQELACDAASLRALPECSANYARALLDSVAVQPVPALIPWLAEPQLKERIAMITRIPPGVLRRRAGFLAIATLLAGGSFVASGAVADSAALPGSTTPATSNVSKGSDAFIAMRAPAPGTSAASGPSVDIAYKNRNPPHYPVEAVKDGQQGNVLLDITVDAAGKVAGVQIDRHGTDAPAVLQIAAVEAAMDWKFNPGRKNGKAVGGVIQVPVNFSLSNDYEKSTTPKPCPVGTVYLTATSQCVKLQSPSTSS